MTFSKDKAEKLANEIIINILQLWFFPYMYQIFYKKYHSFTVNNKRVVYYIDEKNKIVVIYRILWGYQKYENYL
jgi:plasmid stabilization system protein ParE